MRLKNHRTMDRPRSQAQAVASPAPGRGPNGRRRRERGQSLVEFAFVLPLFLVLLCGVIEYGAMLSDQIQLSYASREAARAGAIHFENSPVPIPDADRVTQATTAAQSSSGSLVSCPLNSPTVTPQTSANPELITVQLSCPYSTVTPIGPLVTLLGHVLNLPSTLSSSSTRYVEP